MFPDSSSRSSSAGPDPTRVAALAFSVPEDAPQATSPQVEIILVLAFPESFPVLPPAVSNPAEP